MPQVSQSPAPVDPTPSQANAHLAQLHRMSTTAGVTNLDYVALSHLAIVAVLLGLASALALFGWLLLVVPLVGIVFAIVAIRQINDSSGTQSGRGLAIAGLILCLLFGGGEVVKEVMAITAVSGDKAQISVTLAQAGSLIREQKYKEAYALFDPTFQSYFKFEQFQSIWTSVQSPRSLGPLESMQWNGVVDFETAAGARVALTNAKMKFARSQEERFEVTLRKVGEKWLILRFPSFFAEPKANPNRDDFNIDSSSSPGGPRGPINHP